VDRRYIEAFLSARRGAIHGSVLEVQDSAYTTRFGGDRVSQSTVVDIDATNLRATLIADLQMAGSLPPDSYDCVILTQTLHLLRRPGQCIQNCFAALRSDGVLLATAPSVSRVSPTYPEGDLWRFTPAGIAELFGRYWPGDFTVDAFGNLRTCMAFLIGEVVEELPDLVLDHHDPRFPLTVTVEATKTPSHREAPNDPPSDTALPRRSSSRRSGHPPVFDLCGGSGRQSERLPGNRCGLSCMPSASRIRRSGTPFVRCRCQGRP
jgi:SAM-dependent methyltransferase